MRRGGRKSGGVSAVAQYSCDSFQEPDETADIVHVNSPQGPGTVDWFKQSC